MSSPALGISVPETPRATARRKKFWRNVGIFLLVAGPNYLVLMVFTYRPMFLSFYYSLLNWNLGSEVAQFIGLGNYVEWVNDPETPRVLLTTFVYALFTVVGGMVGGLALALALNRKLVGRGIVRTVTFAPYVLSGIAVGFLWMYIFNPNIGLLSIMLGWFDVASPEWFTQQPWPLLMIIIVTLWKHVGYVALIYLAGLQSVPQDLRDAAALDGAGHLRTFSRITLPLLGPITFFLLVTLTLSALQSFDLIRAMTNGGPLGSTKTLMFQVYVEGFQIGRAGYGSAVATVLFVVLLAITVIQMKFVERRVHYQ
ncbi:carbohydrate ABC transporter permease [Occultella aeris]|nr:sugar ABC transporter permease [Occultella aeris]